MKKIVIDIEVLEENYFFATNLEDAISNAKKDLEDVEKDIEESIITIQSLTPDCDKLDYILSASMGALSGLVDVFLVGKPGASPVGDVTDKWFADRTKDFSKLCGWDGGDGSLSSAIRHLEKKFKIPYDQRGAGDAASEIFDIKPGNHHFKSLGHNPTLAGLFFSILDQFMNHSHFVTGGELIALEEADGKFQLRGNDVPSKLFCGFINWFGHLVSDVSGSSSSKGRGAGIPSPFWAWTNSIMAIKKSLNIPTAQFDESMNELALSIYKQGYDARFQTAQAIPIFINELLVRFAYAIRRMIRYFKDVPSENRSIREMWKSCEPFSNVSVKRMLSVAHGSFCLVDLSDAVARGFIAGGGYFNVVEFAMRLNIVGIGRFSVSLYGEFSSSMRKSIEVDNEYFLQRKKKIVENYIEGLNVLSKLYDDHDLLLLIADLESSNVYCEMFSKTIELAEKRRVPEDKILRTKTDIDKYFGGI